MNDSRGFHAIKVRHGQIEHDDIWFQLCRHRNGFASRCGLSADFPGAVILECFMHTSSNHQIVISDQDAQHNSAVVIGTLAVTMVP